MGAFEYTALDASGKERRGVMEGDTARHVRGQLREQQLLPVSVNELARQEAEDDDLSAVARDIESLPSQH